MSHFAWSWPDETAERGSLGRQIASALAVPEPIGRALAARGMDISRCESIAESSLLSCTAALGDPPGVAEAAEALIVAARDGRVGILCDYDVDGATSQAILVETLRAFGPPGFREPAVAVPERNTEGFGPNRRCLEQLAAAGVTCVAVLDCGTSSGRLLDGFSDSTGIPTVVVDHHPPHGGTPPKGAALVNPWVGPASKPGEHRTLCAAALTWFVARSVLRQAGLSASETVGLRKRITLLAALGTSCDMMPLDFPFNRALVRVGVALFDHPANRSPGLQGICDAAGLRGASSASDFSWRIGPRINAGSRMGESDLAARCLRERNQAAATSLARRLDEHNRSRRALGRKTEEEIESRPDRRSIEDGPVSVLVSQSATPGTAGLAASSLVKRFGWPAIVLAKREGNSLAGSGRSALAFDLGLAVSVARHDGILLSGGGHAMACGVELEAGRLDEFRDHLVRRFESHAASASGPTVPTHVIDCVLRGEELAAGPLLSLVEGQSRLEPWGQGLAAPLYGVRECFVTAHPLIRKGHVFLRLESDRRQFDAVWWGAPGDWSRRLAMGAPAGDSSNGESRLGADLACAVELDDWNGRRAGRLVVRDARPRAN